MWQRTTWWLAQVVGVTAMGALVAGLLVRPEASLNVFWNGLVPVLPAVFLVSPPLWRNVCPLATLNVLTGNRVGGRRMSASTTRALGGVGILLLITMIPARRLLLNHNGPALALAIGAVGVLALVLGALFVQKSGYCNAICPVLPVERLYGQHPILQIGNPRCTPCVGCTQAGCVDRVPLGAIDELVGKGDGNRWLSSPLGAFALAFPGLVLAYFMLPDGTLADAPVVYGTVLLGMGVCYVLLAGLQVMGIYGRRALIRFGAALAIGLYYWLAAPTITSAWGLQPAFSVSIRGVALTLVVFWFWRAATIAPATSLTPTATPR